MQYKQNRFASLQFIYPASVFSVYLSAFYDMFCQHNQHYDMGNCSNAPESKYGFYTSHATCRSRPPEPTAWGNKLFRNMHIFSQGIILWNWTAKLLPSVPFKGSMLMKSSTNPLVRFQIGPSQVLSRCSDYWDATILGLLRAGCRSNCHVCRNAKGGCLRIQLNI